MIFDYLSEQTRYAAVHPLLARGLAFLAHTDLERLPSGKVTIEGDQLFALVNDYTTSPLEQCRFEAHRRYTDIQLMVSGIEQIGVTYLSRVEETEAYIAERDIAFYRGEGDRITLREGTFAVFFPHDAHQPGIAVASPQAVRKVVVKVALD